MSEAPKKSLALNHNLYNHHLQPDTKNIHNREILNILLSLISPNKFEKIRQEALVQLQKDINELGDIRKIALNSDSVALKICSVCKEFFSKPLNCGCFLCSHLSSELENQIQEFMNLSVEESIQILPQITCPKCNMDLNEGDMERLHPEYRSKKNEIRKRKIEQNMQSNGEFNCESCGKTRGIDCWPQKNILYCMHMCSICICKRYLDNKNTSCDHCDAKVDMNAMAAEMRNCHNCKNNQYILGDRMMESSPGHLLCLPCMLESVNKGYCPLSDRIYTFQEKRECYQYVYVQCQNCGTDIYHYLKKKLSCCKKIYCEQCTDSGMCPHCKSPARYD